MSQENVEIMRRFFDAFERDGLDGLLRQLHPRSSGRPPGLSWRRPHHRGHEEVRGYLGSLLSEFENPPVVPEELIEAGDQAVTSWRFSGQGKQSGAAVEVTLTSVSSLRDGRSPASATTRTGPRPSKPWGCRSSRPLTPLPLIRSSSNPSDSSSLNRSYSRRSSRIWRFSSRSTGSRSTGLEP